MTKENNIYGTITGRKRLETGVGYQKISHIGSKDAEAINLSQSEKPIEPKNQGINLIGQELMFCAEKKKKTVKLRTWKIIRIDCYVIARKHMYHLLAKKTQVVTSDI